MMVWPAQFLNTKGGDLVKNLFEKIFDIIFRTVKVKKIVLPDNDVICQDTIDCDFLNYDVIKLFPSNGLSLPSASSISIFIAIIYFAACGCWSIISSRDSSKSYL